MGKYIDKLKSNINKNGKGDKVRPINKAKYDSNWEGIMWKSKTKYDKLLNKIVKKG